MIKKTNWMEEKPDMDMKRFTKENIKETQVNEKKFFFFLRREEVR